MGRGFARDTHGTHGDTRAYGSDRRTILQPTTGQLYSKQYTTNSSVHCILLMMLTCCVSEVTQTHIHTHTHTFTPWRERCVFIMNTQKRCTPQACCSTQQYSCYFLVLPPLRYPDDHCSRSPRPSPPDNASLHRRQWRSLKHNPRCAFLCGP